MQIHPVYFEVVNDGNAARFLSEALINLQLVDSTAQILPHRDMPEETETFNNINQIPNDASVSNFTHAYLSGLRVTTSSMKGKLWIRCLKNFPQFKSNAGFLKWLEAENSTRRIILDRMVMQGTEWFAVGFFVNAIAELRLVDNFNDRLGLALLSIKKGDIPEFQCDVGTIYNKNVPT